FSSRGLVVIGVNVRETKEAARRYAKELGLTFPLVLDRDGKINALYGVVGLPTTFVIGRDGRAVGFAVGPREWESASARALITALLAEPVPPLAARCRHAATFSSGSPPCSRSLGPWLASAKRSRAASSRSERSRSHGDPPRLSSACATVSRSLAIARIKTSRSECASCKATSPSSRKQPGPLPVKGGMSS